MTGEPGGTDYLLTGLAVPEGIDDLHALLGRVREENSDLSATDGLVSALLEAAS